VNRLRGREVRAEPEPVSGLEVGDLGDGQGAAVAGDVDVNFGADEVEAAGIGVQHRAEGQEGSESSG
jgi:hypothetical protein